MVVSIGTSIDLRPVSVIELITQYSLSRYIVDLRHGKVAKHEDETQLMKNMVEIYGTFKQKIRSQDVYNIANSSRGEVSEGDVVVRQARLLTSNRLTFFRSLPELQGLLELTFSINFAPMLPFPKSFVLSVLSMTPPPKPGSVNLLRIVSKLPSTLVIPKFNA